MMQRHHGVRFENVFFVLVLRANGVTRTTNKKEANPSKKKNKGCKEEY